MSDPGYGIDKLREEERERSGLVAERQKRVIYELTVIKGSLFVAAAALIYIAWRLT
jgi:hypothetical protein